MNVAIDVAPPLAIRTRALRLTMLLSAALTPTFCLGGLPPDAVAQRAAAVKTQSSVTAEVQRVRFVVIHKPGPQWRAGVPMLEQPGLQAHVDHYRKLLTAGKLMLGGPFLDAAGGGMMIPTPQVTEAEMSAFAAADPAVLAGLLVFEIRPWLPTLTHL